MIILKIQRKNSVNHDEILLLNGVEMDEFLIDSNISIIQGDIIVDKWSFNNKTRKKRRIIANNVLGNPTRWPNRTIPYEFDYDASNLLSIKQFNKLICFILFYFHFYFKADALKKKVLTAIDIWQQNTCNKIIHK